MRIIQNYIKNKNIILKENESIIPREDSQLTDDVKNRKDLISISLNDACSEKIIIPKRKSPRLKLKFSYLNSDKYEENYLGNKSINECKRIELNKERKY